MTFRDKEVSMELHVALCRVKQLEEAIRDTLNIADGRGPAVAIDCLREEADRLEVEPYGSDPTPATTDAWSGGFAKEEGAGDPLDRQRQAGVGA